MIEPIWIVINGDFHHETVGLTVQLFLREPTEEDLAKFRRESNHDEVEAYKIHIGEILELVP